MKIGGFVKNSFVDYPQHISAVVFTCGCNFNCWYCHNKQLVENKDCDDIDEKVIFDFLKQRQGLIEGVVITGGEPTMQPDLIDFIKKIKKLGYKIKLDTNGAKPEILKFLLDEKLVDYVAMDIKQQFNKYSTITKNENLTLQAMKSKDMLLNCDIDYEFRTTFSPDITLDDIEVLAKEIAGAKAYYIQKYNAPNTQVVTIPHTLSDFEKAKTIAQKYVKNTNLRSVE